MLKKISLFILFLLFVMVISCGDDSKNGDEEKEVPDQEEIVPDEEETVDEDEDEDADEFIDEDVFVDYPETSGSSKKRGDIAQNLHFYDHEDKELSLGHFYKEKKLIWLIFSTYDCTYCKVQKNAIPELNKDDFVDRGFQVILIMNGYNLPVGPKPEEEPEKIAELRDAMLMAYGSQGDHVYGYLSREQQSMFRNFINQGYPVNIFIDGSTMEILDHFEGWSAGIQTKVEGFIDFMLDEL